MNNFNQFVKHDSKYANGTRDTAILCKKEEEAKLLIKIAKKEGLVWAKDCTTTHWDRYKEKTCYSFSQWLEGMFGAIYSLDTCQNKNVDIDVIEFKDFLEKYLEL